MCPRAQGSEIDLEGGMETGTGKTLQMTLLVFISLAAFVMVGIEQGKEGSKHGSTSRYQGRAATAQEGKAESSCLYID